MAPQWCFVIRNTVTPTSPLTLLRCSQTLTLDLHPQRPSLSSKPDSIDNSFLKQDSDELKLGPYTQQVQQLNSFSKASLMKLQSYKPATQDARKLREAVSGSSIVTLFHPEEQAFLACDDEGKVDFLQTSSQFHPKCLWTFVRERDGTGGMGEALYTSYDETRWAKDRMLVRLQHNMTGRFLTLSGDAASGYECMAVTAWKGTKPVDAKALSNWEGDSGGQSLWGLRPYSGIDENGAVMNRSQVLLKNTLGNWLHASRNEHGAMEWTGSKVSQDKDALEVSTLSSDDLVILDTCDHFTSSLNKILLRLRESGAALTEEESDQLSDITVSSYRQEPPLYTDPYTDPYLTPLLAPTGRSLLRKRSASKAWSRWPLP